MYFIFAHPLGQEKMTSIFLIMSATSLIKKGRINNNEKNANHFLVKSAILLANGSNVTLRKMHMYIYLHFLLKSY